MVFPGVTDPEKVPLRVAVRIDVVLKDQVVLVVAYFHGHQQVARLKARLKHKRLVVRTLWYVKWRGWKFSLLFHVFSNYN